MDIHFKMYFLFSLTFCTRKRYIKGNFPNSLILRGIIFAEAQIPQIGVILRSSIEVIIN